MNSYLAIGAYAGLGLTVFLLGLVWGRYAANVRRLIRKTVVRRHPQDAHDRDHFQVPV